MTFSELLKRTVVGHPASRLVFLGNFEVEKEWARGAHRLPRSSLDFSAATVNRMEEMGIFLADDHDLLLLKEPPDPEYLAYLSDFKVGGAEILHPAHTDRAQRITEGVLASAELIDGLRARADGRTYLAPLGVSASEEELSQHTTLPLAFPAAAVARAVNSKVFGRALVTRCGLRAVPGASCHTVQQVSDALELHLRPGSRVVVKEAWGVSGRGMVVLDDHTAAGRLLRLLARRAPEVDVVIERWIDKAADLNYQFTVGRNGDVEFDTVKAAVVEAGVHRGHRWPIDLSPAVLAEIQHAANIIGADLAAHRYWGPVGVDAILARDGVLYPCLEINARFNMAHYQNCVADRIMQPGGAAEAAYTTVHLDAPRSFGDFVAPIEDLLLRPDGTRGVMITNFATVNASAGSGDPFRGKVGVLCVDTSAAGAGALRAELDERLTR